jgi:hypothetical protein
MTNFRNQSAIVALALFGFAGATPARADELLGYVRADFGYAMGVAGSNGTIVTGPGFGNDFGDSVSYGGGVGAKLPGNLGPVSLRFDLTGAFSPSLGGGAHTGSCARAMFRSPPLSNATP